MDKYEFNIKVEQIKKLVSENDYVTAMKIADSIDWSRVRNANLLSMVAGVYEKNGEYQEAKDILLLAFERAPVGKRLLFKLAELSVRSGDLDEAEDFYREFTDLAPDDSRAFLLEYLILKAKGAPASQLIHSLEQYTSQELDERWLYELAELYARAGMGAECVRVCDKITLLFGLGKYSERALLLKQNFTDLSDYQKDLVENRGKYEDKLRKVEAESAKQEALYERGYAAAGGEANAPAESAASADAGSEEAHAADGNESSEENGDGFSEEISDALANQRYTDEDTAFEAYLRAHEDALNAASQAEPLSEAEEKIPAAAVRIDEDYINEGFSDVLSKEVKALGTENGEVDLEADSSEGGLEKTRVLDEEIKEKLRKIVIKADQAAEMPKVVNVDVQAAKAGAMAQAAVIAGAAAAAGSAEKAAAHAVPEIRKQERPRPQARVGFTHTDEKEAGAEDGGKPEVSEAEISKEKISREATAAKKLDEKASEEKRPEEKTGGAAEPAPQEASENGRADNAEKVAEHGPFHMIIEAETPSEGLVIAIDELKYIHNEYSITNAAAKTTAEKLNERGLSKAALEKLCGKDFIVEHAGALKKELAQQILGLIKTDRTGMIVVLVDTPGGLDKLEETAPELFDLCDLVSDEYEEGGDEAAAEDADSDYEEAPYEDEPYEEEAEEDDGAVSKEAENGLKAEDTSAKRRDEKEAADSGAKKPAKESVLRQNDAARDEQMEIDDFAQYCCQYASSIDCSITGKSMLALYERIELMEEDNIPLTKETAEDLIEEAADRAEKPPIGKRLKGMFNSKYDKNGLLILKEEDFIH